MQSPANTAPRRSRLKEQHEPDLFPPEHIEPVGTGYQFSYIPLHRNLSADSSSSESDNAEGSEAAEDSSCASSPEIEYQSAPSASKRAVSVHVRAIDVERDFTIEELSDDDIGYDEVEVILPDTFEDAESTRGRDENTEIFKELSSIMQDLHCASFTATKDNADIQFGRYLRKKKRWSKGGSHKRSHAESIGSDSEDNEDIELLDDQQAGSSARRLRRRTQGPQDKPRTSLLFDDPPREIEELRFLDDNPDLAEISRNTPTFITILEQHEEIDITELQDGAEELSALPYWLYPMEIESPSRPTSVYASRRLRR